MAVIGGVDGIGNLLLLVLVNAIDGTTGGENVLVFIIIIIIYFR